MTNLPYLVPHPTQTFSIWRERSAIAIEGQDMDWVNRKANVVTLYFWCPHPSLA